MTPLTPLHRLSTASLSGYGPNAKFSNVRFSAALGGLSGLFMLTVSVVGHDPEPTCAVHMMRDED
jgi:hypothetical protein